MRRSPKPIRRPDRPQALPVFVRKISPRVFGKMDRMEILTKLGVVVQDPEEAGGLKPTLAGLFAAGIYPQEFFPRLNVAFIVYPGAADGAAGCARTPKTQSVNGSIPEMLERSLELLEACMKEGAGSGNVVADYPLAARRSSTRCSIATIRLRPEALRFKSTSLPTGLKSSAPAACSARHRQAAFRGEFRSQETPPCRSFLSTRPM